MENKVYIIGAGPGDPELLTLKAKKLIEKADIIVYAGSLVPRSILKFKKKGARCHNSAKLSLNKIIRIIERGVKVNKAVVRLHTGDPSIYGAIHEEMEALGIRGIVCEVVPGVSSFLAAAAALKKELTIPDLTQTVILTRLDGRTPVPKKESLESLAKHNASLVIFLSAHMIDKIAAKLKGIYSPRTPAAIVYRASWNDEKKAIGTIENIAKKAKALGVKNQAIIFIGSFLTACGRRSKLYDESFMHSFRK